MKKKKEREPELIQFRLEFCFNEDLPAEKFFMAYNQYDALAQLALSFVKELPFTSLSEEEKDCFVKAFSNPSAPFLEKPVLLPIPEPIPDMDFPEPEQELLEIKNENTETVEEEGFLGISPQEEDANPVVELQPKPDPATEHSAKQEERLAQIAEIEKKNHTVSEKYEYLYNQTQKITQWFSEHIEIFNFEEYNRWSDSWHKIDYPLLPAENEDSVEQQHPDHPENS